MIELLVLITLFFGPCHGYEIKKMHPGVKINNNTLYPMLSKMVDEGLVSMTLMTQENKPSKKVYSLTDKGKEALFALVTDFDDKDAASDDAFYIRVAFFQFLSKESVQSILEARETYLEHYEERQDMMKALDYFPDDSKDIGYIKDFLKVKIAKEKQFVSELKKKYHVNR